jgi:putative ABC transport system permease protein
LRPGFESNGVMTFRLALLGPEYEGAAARTAAVASVTERLRQLPGVEAAGAVTLLPIADCCSQFGFQVEGQETEPGHGPMATGNLITPDYFKAMQIPLERGRIFTEADRAGAPRVIVVSHTFAATHWPGVDPLGRRINMNDEWHTVVGVVGDIRQTTLVDQPEPQFYMPYAQDPWDDMRFAVRVGKGDPAALAPSIRSAVQQLVPTVPVFALRSMDSIMSDSLKDRRLYGVLLAGFSLVALALATAGVYGVMSYFVSQRTHEIGVRMALGASASGVRRMVLGQGARVAIIGLVLGLVGAALAARALAHVLYGITAGEMPIYLIAAGVLGLTALIATLVPARRASGVDPMVALRAE